MTDTAFLNGAVPELIEPRPSTETLPALLGRPSDYTREIAHRICLQVADHGKCIRDLANEGGWPPRSTIYLWLKTQPEFYEAYQIAKECYRDEKLDEALEVAMSDGKDIEILPAGENGEPAIVIRKDIISRDKLKVSALFKTVAILEARERQFQKAIAEQPAGNGDDAKVVEGVAVDLTNHPMRDQILAWRKPTPPKAEAAPK